MTFLKFGSGVLLSITVSKGPYCLWGLLKLCLSTEWCLACLPNSGVVIWSMVQPWYLSLYLHHFCALCVLFLTISDLSLCVYVYVCVCVHPYMWYMWLLSKHCFQENFMEITNIEKANTAIKRVPNGSSYSPDLSFMMYCRWWSLVLFTFKIQDSLSHRFSLYLQMGRCSHSL